MFYLIQLIHAAPHLLARIHWLTSSRSAAPQGRKPQGRHKGDGPKNEAGRQLTAQDRDALRRVRDFGIDSSKLSDTQILAYLDTHTQAGAVEALIDEYYTSKAPHPNRATVRMLNAAIPPWMPVP